MFFHFFYQIILKLELSRQSSLLNTIFDALCKVLPGISEALETVNFLRMPRAAKELAELLTQMVPSVDCHHWLPGICFFLCPKATIWREPFFPDTGAMSSFIGFFAGQIAQSKVWICMVIRTACSYSVYPAPRFCFTLEDAPGPGMERPGLWILLGWWTGCPNVKTLESASKPKLSVQLHLFRLSFLTLPWGKL